MLKRVSTRTGRPLRRAAQFLRGRARMAMCASCLVVGLLPMPAYALETVDLSVPGASEELLATLRASSLVLSAQSQGQVSPVDLMAAARAEYGRLIGLLYEEGHYAPTIAVRIDGREAANMSPLFTPSRINRIDIDIDLGPLFTFGTSRVSPLAAQTALPDGFATGQPARSTTVRAAVRAAVEGWQAQGHPHARVVGQDVVANHATNQLNVSVQIAPGPQLRLGQLRPQGNERTRSERIEAIAGLPSGEIHTPQALDAAQERLRETGAFSSVVLRTAERDNGDGSVDVVAEVDEALPRRLGFGIELDSEAGLRLSGFWLHRNLLGGAERLRLEASVEGIGARTGGLGYSLDALYTRPATLNRDTDLELGLRALRVSERDFNADSIELRVHLNRQFSEQLSASAGVDLLHERAEFGGATRNFGTLGLPVSVTHDTRDERLNATRGHYVSAQAMPFAGFGAADSGFSFRLDARSYADFGSSGKFVLATRAQLGAIYGTQLASTPRGYLFYSGGGGTVRGLPYQSLGVTDGGIASGGLGFAALSAEMRMRVNDSFSIVAFADAGHVSAGPLSGASDWHAGGGVGLRYNTPIGPMRLDLATPIRRNATAGSARALQLYLGIGQAF